MQTSFFKQGSLSQKLIAATSQQKERTESELHGDILGVVNIIA